MTAPFQVAKPLPDDVRRALVASIKSFGVLVPIIEDQHGRIIDGHHRAEIAADLGVDAPVEVVQVEDDEHAKTLAVTLNADRRHLSPEDRRAIVAQLRSEGHSLRSIADSHGVSHTTIKRDSGQVEPPVPPAHVEGTDGKQYAPTEEARQDQRQTIAEMIDRNPTASDRWIGKKVGASHHTVASVRAEAPTVSTELREAEEAEHERQRALERDRSRVEALVRGWLMVRQWDEPKQEVIDLLVTDQDREMFFELWSRIHD